MNCIIKHLRREIEKMFIIFSISPFMFLTVISASANEINYSQLYINSFLSYNCNYTTEGRILNTGTDGNPIWEWEYYLKDHLGNVRVVIEPTNTPGYSNVLQETHYYPFGMLMSQLSSSANSTNDYLFSGKQLERNFDLGWYDFGGRENYNAPLGIWHSIDRFAEKYLNFTPYQYAANNPIRFIDINGDSINVEEQYRQDFMNDLQNTYGDNSKSFSFNETGMLVFNGNKKDLTKDQLKAFKGMNKLMTEETTTNVVYGDNYSVESDNGTINMNALKQGGAMTQKDVSINGQNQNFIVVSKNIGEVIVTSDITLQQVNVSQNTTTGLFHEFGEAICKNPTFRGNVITYENYVRKIMGLPVRPTDLSYHSNKYPIVIDDLSKYRK
jgi:RHS repeat-associated protein